MNSQTRWFAHCPRLSYRPLGNRSACAAAASELKGLGAVPFAAHVSDPCDGRSQGTTAMFDSLAYRNDASLVMRRLVRSLPTARALMGVATCDKSMPAMMMTLAGFPELPSILLPGGVTLSAKKGEDAGKAQSLGIRFAHGEVSLDEASEKLCNTCASQAEDVSFLGLPPLPKSSAKPSACPFRIRPFHQVVANRCGMEAASARPELWKR